MLKYSTKQALSKGIIQATIVNYNGIPIGVTYDLSISKRPIRVCTYWDINILDSYRHTIP